MRENDPAEEKPLGLTPADVPIDRLPTIELTETQFQRAKTIARARKESYERINGGQVLGNQTSFDAHLTGAVGEVAFGVETGSPVDDAVYRDGDNGYDFSFGSITIDTKTTATHIERPELIVRADPEPEADVYFLLHRVDSRTIRVVGYTTGRVVKNRTPRRSPSVTLNYVVPQEELRLLPGLEETIVGDSRYSNPHQ